ncbi:MAG: 50S ribosomal protein L21 [candidate division KSB1 bacterium]|nr:50S ribosomal protein L21 [candidate division KSB1 bacterium]MDQ7063637.1 50S ribosomal protein L21 [candidate division KSB1 bacterium]
MYAIVEIAGKQYKIEENSTVITDRLPGESGQTVEFDRVLMVVDGENVKVGTPTVDGAKVTATIEGEVRGPKVLVFKKKRRKGYRKLVGHKQRYSALQINKIEVA